MKQFRIYIILSVIIFILPQYIISQNKNSIDIPLKLSIPAIALLDFKANDNIITYSYSMNAPNQVEQIITPSTHDKTWINYSSIVENGTTNYITVYISSGILPSEVMVNLIIGNDIGAGAGRVGKPANQITLTYFPQCIISDIGSCYTGRGSFKGHQLTYLWINADNYCKSLYALTNYALTITYTIASTD